MHALVPQITGNNLLGQEPPVVRKPGLGAGGVDQRVGAIWIADVNALALTYIQHGDGQIS
jgi:hypothetical protein